MLDQSEKYKITRETERCTQSSKKENAKHNNQLSADDKIQWTTLTRILKEVKVSDTPVFL